MYAFDHAFVQGLLGRHKHAATILQLPQGVGNGRTLVLADQDAIAALAHTAFAHRRIVIENMAHPARATGQRHELALESNQTPRGNKILKEGTAASIGLPVLHVSLVDALFFPTHPLVANFAVSP